MWCQVCHGEVCWVRSYSSCTPPSFSPYGKQALYDYADDSTLVAVVPFSGGRVIVVESLNSDLSKVSMWWDLWGMKLKASKTKTMIVSRSSKIHPQSTLVCGDCCYHYPHRLWIELFWRSLLTVLHRGWRLMLRWPFTRTFAVFSDLQLRGLVLLES